MNTIKTLRQAGYKIRINHYRYLENQTDLVPMYEIRKNGWQQFITPKGGKTIMQVTTATGYDYQVVAGCKQCDSFNRKVAVLICLGRLGKLEQKNAEILLATKPNV